MKSVPVSRLSNDALVRELKDSVAYHWSHTARQVALIAEVDRRRLYAPAGYPSMFEFCVGELHLSEDAAYKRIQAARAARRCPQVLVALARGRVHLTGVIRLRPYLTTENATELLDAATHKSTAEILKLLAERFPSSDLPAGVVPMPTVIATELVSKPVPHTPTQTTDVMGPLLANDISHVDSAPSVEPARVAPLAPQRYGVQFTFDQASHDLLRHVQSLLGSRVPPGDLAEVFARALKVYAAQLEKRKFAATDRPAMRHRPIDPDSRHIASRVKRAVWRRDKGQCTYVSDTGKRCESRWDLEFDHELEYARGGEASAANIRLRCRAHNQHGAEQTYGAGFMERKREISAGDRERAATARGRAPLH